MSATPPGTDILGSTGYVRKVPKGDILAWHDTDEATK
jgi:hypothetical protein